MSRCLDIANRMSAADRDALLDLLGDNPTQEEQIAAVRTMMERIAGEREMLAELLRSQHPDALGIFVESVWFSARPDNARAQLNTVIAARNKTLKQANPASVLEADIERAARAVEIVMVEIQSGGKLPLMEVPIGPMPHAVRLAGAPMQMTAIATSIIKKVLVDKHDADFTGVTSREFVEALYRPALVIKAANGDFELMSQLVNRQGVPVMFALMPDAQLPGGVAKAAMVKSAYSRDQLMKPGAMQLALASRQVKYADIDALQALEEKSPTVARAFGRARPASEVVAASSGAKAGSHFPAKSDSADFRGEDRPGINLGARLVTGVGSDRLGLSTASPFVRAAAQATGLGTVKGYGDLVKFLADKYQGPADDMPRFSRRAPDTPEFRRWFGDSRVVDSSGEPKVMYRGTGYDIEAFRRGVAGAIFLTDSPSFANEFSMRGMGTDAAQHIEAMDVDGLAPNVMPVYVRAENPFDYENTSHVYRVANAVNRAGEMDRVARVAVDWIEVAKKGGWGVIESEAFQRAIRAEGFDGFYVREDGRKNLAVYDPEQIKSAIGNRGTFDPADPRITYSRRGQPGAFRLPEFTRLDMTIEAIQDRYNRWRQATQAVREQGGNVNDINDFYLAEERYWSRVGSRVDDFKAELEQWVKEIADDGLDLDSVALYAYAKHAPERNAWIAMKRPAMTDGGSGMSNQDAADIIHDAQVSGLQPLLEKHVARLHEFIQGTRDSLYQDGLIDDDEYLAWSSLFQHYVPLRGLEGKPEAKGTGQGFNIRGAEGKAAKGRYSQARQIIEQVVQDRVRAYMRAGKNEVGRTFLQFVLDNPSPNLWEVNAVQRKPVSKLDANGNRIIEEEMTVVDDERVVTVKDAGQEIHILVHDERLRAQLQNMHVENVGRVVGSLLWVNRQLSKLYTALSPVFLVLNASRDLQSATVGVIDEVGFMGVPRLYANLPRAILSSYKAEFGAIDPDFELYRQSGGKTGFFDFKTLDAQARELQDMLDMAGSSAIDPRKLWHRAMAVIEGANGGVENAFRLAAFQTALQSGMSTVQAARMSKNITVNFNRKGTMTPALSAWFLFFNPAVQGTARVAQALRSPKVLATLGMGMTGMFLLALRNASMGDDDDGVAWWDKIPDEVKERNLVIVLPPGASGGESIPASKVGRYIKVPMPYGYNFFAVVANQMADVWRHSQDPRRGRDATKGMLKAAQAFMGAWVPATEVGRSFETPEAAALAFVPDALNPLVQNALNLNTFGRKMRPDDARSEALPDSQQFFIGQHGTLYQQLASELNAATGGDEVTPGLIDVSPASIENVVRGYGGGPASFAMDLLNVVYVRHSVERPAADWSKAPFAKQLTGVIDDETDRLVGYERLMDAEEKDARLDAASKMGGDKVRALLEREGRTASLGDQALAVRQQLA
ncbi:MAG: hypothetical protein HY856_13605 [Burkholderiales bacterium]|nr:hypothetical protein [Burkholderiales bacterium]